LSEGAEGPAHSNGEGGAYRAPPDS